MKYISGKFLENEQVTVEIDGKIITRKVRYNRADGLYIMYNNRKYFEYECEYLEGGKSMRNDKITINRNGKVITGIHDHHIYDLFYKGVSIGYFAEYYLEKAVKSIEETGFFDGKNYDFRIKNIDESGNEELIMKEIKDCIKKYNHKR